MIHRNWKSYQEDLAAYNVAKVCHETAINEWKAELIVIDFHSIQADYVNSFGCFALILAGIIAYAKGVAGYHWGWFIVFLIALGIYQTLDQKCRYYQKRRYLATVPCPQFTLDEPIYEPPPENYQQQPPLLPPETEKTPTLAAALSVLGLSRRHTIEELKKAYRDRIREYHPDKVSHLGSEIRQLAERKAKEINAAYEYASKAFQDHSHL